MDFYSNDEATAIQELLHAAIGPAFTGLSLDEASRRVENAAGDFVILSHLPRETPSDKKRDLLQIANQAKRLVQAVCASPNAQYEMNCAAARDSRPLVSDAIESVLVLRRLADQAGRAISTKSPDNPDRHGPDEVRETFLGALFLVWIQVTGTIPPISRQGPFVDFVQAASKPLVTRYPDTAQPPNASAIERFLQSLKKRQSRAADAAHDSDINNVLKRPL